eukprot:2275153-Pyramimonas_sp.AAC.1
MELPWCEGVCALFVGAVPSGDRRACGDGCRFGVLDELADRPNGRCMRVCGVSRTRRRGRRARPGRAGGSFEPIQLPVCNSKSGRKDSRRIHLPAT